MEKKIGRQRATEAGSKKLMLWGEKKESSRGAIGKWTRNDDEGKLEKFAMDFYK